MIKEADAIFCRCGMAERVGFVPDESATLNDLGRIGTARNRQIH
jgi:hypothetical protein